MTVLDLKIMDANEERLDASGGNWNKLGRVIRLMKRYRRPLVLGLLAIFAPRKAAPLCVAVHVGILVLLSLSQQSRNSH